MMKYISVVVFLSCFALSAFAVDNIRDSEKRAWVISEIRIRDPFILTDKETGLYYMYAQMDNRLDKEGDDKGVEVYTSKNLKEWLGPEPVLNLPQDSWATNMVWAPEVHAYQGKYYLFVTLTAYDTLSEGKPFLDRPWPTLYKRGTQIFVSESPTGPFKAFEDKPHTPQEWSSLDGTLWVENETPYMIFCHEWTQIKDGSMDLVELEKDLSAAKGRPKELFHASDGPWVLKKPGMVTDGCFLYKTHEGHLLMIWSSFGKKGYAIGLVRSESGSIHGPWEQIDEPLFRENGGHGMIFTTFDGRLMLTLHQPNRSPEERAKIFELVDTGNELRIGKEM